MLAGYLRAEQELGRVRADADPVAAAGLLMGACFQHAFLSHFRGGAPDRGAVTGYSATLWAALSPSG